METLTSHVPLPKCAARSLAGRRRLRTNWCPHPVVKQARSSAQEKLSDLRGQQARRERRQRLTIWTAAITAVVVVAGVVAATVIVSRNTPRAGPLHGGDVYARVGAHGGPCHLRTDTLAGGDTQAATNCGTYEAPVTNENAVHSMEHGAVWVTPSRPARRPGRDVASVGARHVHGAIPLRWPSRAGRRLRVGQASDPGGRMTPA